jgi:hypothetical protein
MRSSFRSDWTFDDALDAAFDGWGLAGVDMRPMYGRAGRAESRSVGAAVGCRGLS